MDTRHPSERLLAAMLSADRQAAARLVEAVLAEGQSPRQFITEVLDPTLARLGLMWEQKAASLAHTFSAAKIAEDVLRRCLPAADRTSVRPAKGRVVLGNIEDDFHSLGRRVVSSFLTAAGWEVHDLGNDVTAEQFVDKALELGAAVVGASAMTLTTALNIRKVREALDARRAGNAIRLAVGGAVFNWRPDLVSEVGGDGTAKNASGADALCTRLQAAALGAGEDPAPPRAEGGRP